MSTEIPEDLVSTALAAIRAEHAKLKYRINVLDRVCHTKELKVCQLSTRAYGKVLYEKQNRTFAQ